MFRTQCVRIKEVHHLQDNTRYKSTRFLVLNTVLDRNLGSLSLSTLVQSRAWDLPVIALVIIDRETKDLLIRGAVKLRSNNAGSRQVVSTRAGNLNVTALHVELGLGKMRAVKCDELIANNVFSRSDRGWNSRRVNAAVLAELVSCPDTIRIGRSRDNALFSDLGPLQLRLIN